MIKIERPDGGDLCRQLYISNLELDGDSTLFHSINRNKESFAADLKQPDDLARVRAAGRARRRADPELPARRHGAPRARLRAAARGSTLGSSMATVTGYGDRVPGATSRVRICWRSRSRV